MTPRRVLITGGAGYLGSALVHRLAHQAPWCDSIVALDVRSVPEDARIPGVHYETLDIQDPALLDRLQAHRITTVVHLASIVNPGGPRRRDFEYGVDVLGTKNVLESCVAAGVEHLIVTSSGAAYGYHADNPKWIRETDPLRGNPEFSYSHHKRLVENLLADFRRDQPQLRQLVFRPGTILGASTDNRISRLFTGRWILGIRGTDSRFVFAWDTDVVRCLELAIEQRKVGVFNLAGDGTLTLREIAVMLRKPYIPLPAWLLRVAIGLAYRVGWTEAGPEQVLFLQYRPVLDNRKLKEEFGYKQGKTTAETFAFFVDHRLGRGLTRGGDDVS